MLKLNNKKNKSMLPYLIMFAAALLFPVLLSKNLLDNNYGIKIAGFILIYSIAVSGLDILFGYSGQISLGHAAFFAIGAYGSAMLHGYFNLPILFTMIVSAVFAAAIGAVLAYPASKLVFHFLSLATTAFGEIVFQFLLHSPKGITGDFVGYSTEYISIFGFKFDTNTKFFYFALFSAAIFLLAKYHLVNSRVGRALIAIRENSHAAAGMGIDVRKYKVMAFAISAFFTAYAGALYAHFNRYISADTFNYTKSVSLLTMLLFGGTASLPGPICGVIAIQLLTELLRAAEKYQMIIYGALLLIVIVALPGGLYGEAKKLFLKVKGGKSNAGSK